MIKNLTSYKKQYRKNMKKNNAFITLLLIVFASTIFGMESENNNNKNWLSLVTDSLLYGAESHKQPFLQDQAFENLPLDERAKTLLFLSKNNTASSLNFAAYAINSLTKINKQLDTLINNPTFCLQLIKRLAQRFNCSDETAAEALQTTEAQKRLVIQKEFEALFSKYYFNKIEFEHLYNAHKNYVDLNFTYKNFYTNPENPYYDHKDTLLIISAMTSSPYITIKISSLLKTNKIDVNYQNALKETALVKYAKNNNNPIVLELLSGVPNIAEKLLLVPNNNADASLKSAANAINSLANINGQLNRLINNPAFCLQLIKRLAQQFNCSDETAAEALQTTEAQKRLAIQKEFETLFSQSDYFETHTYKEKDALKTEQIQTLYEFNAEEFKELYNKYIDYVDLNFTYKNFKQPKYDDKDTLLINSVVQPSPYQTVKISSLLETNQIDINYQNALKETALIKCAYNCDNPATLQLLCNVPNIQLDLQDENNNTALTKICLIKQKAHKAICISILLRAGADPEKIGSYGKTPLAILKIMGDNKTEIKLIENAIKKKNTPRVQITEIQKEPRTKKSSSKK